MPRLIPATLTMAEQQTPLHVSFCHAHDHLIFSLALGTGLRLSEIVGLNVGDVFTKDGKAEVELAFPRESPS
jgi:integrase